MEHAELVGYCLAKLGAYPDHPWENDLVAKVGGKIFVFLGRDPDTVAAPPATSGEQRPPWFTAKATAEDTLAWRQRYPDHITSAPYLQKTTWSRIRLPAPGEDGPTDPELCELVDDSYHLVVAGLPKSKRP